MHDTTLNGYKQGLISRLRIAEHDVLKAEATRNTLQYELKVITKTIEENDKRQEK